MAQEQEYENFINVAIIKIDSGKVMIVRRKNPETGEGGVQLTWVFPGGKQKNETREECVIRETLAETGYQIRVIRQISLRIHPEFKKVICYHLCSLVSPNQIQKPSEPDEIIEIRWVDPQELKNYFTTNLDGAVAKELGVS